MRLDKILEHVAAASSMSKVDVAEWLSLYLGKRYETLFIFAARQLGMPSVTMMDDVTATAM